MRNAIVLAAGKGTRMHSDLPKVLHKIGDMPMAELIVKNLKRCGAERIVTVVGYGREEVMKVLEGQCDFAVQEPQLGTGHAVMCAADQLGQEGETLILCGDTPLVTADTLQKLCEAHRAAGNGVTVLSAILEDPTGYGRIIRDRDGAFLKITEHKDCTEEERATKEINAGMYLFDTAMLQDSLGKLTNDNAQGEYYLTDTIALIKEAGGRVDAMPVSDTNEILGVNTKLQLAEAERIMSNR